MKIKDGTGRSVEGEHDQFVITRNIRHSELLFNDAWRPSTTKRAPFFSKNAASKWKLSPHSECYLCDQYRYVMIFYERGILSSNSQFTEIRDPDILQELRQQVESDGSDRQQMPLICGTLVRRQRGQGPFDRKLKLLHTPIFALLSVIDCYNFVSDPKLPDLIKNTVV